MPRVLKVFRAHLGFYDTAVAAPSRAAALKAWGSRQNLFREGVASETKDPRAVTAALAKPGVVLRPAGGDRRSLQRKSPDCPKSPTRRRSGRPQGRRQKRRRPGPRRGATRLACGWCLRRQSPSRRPGREPTAPQSRPRRRRSLNSNAKSSAPSRRSKSAKPRWMKRRSAGVPIFASAAKRPRRCCRTRARPTYRSSAGNDNETYLSCSNSEFSSAPNRMTICPSQIHIRKPTIVPSEP